MTVSAVGRELRRTLAICQSEAMKEAKAAPRFGFP